MCKINDFVVESYLTHKVLCRYKGIDENVSIPYGITEIGSRAFAGCTNLSKVTILEGVGIIDNEAFSECINLADISIPKTVFSIGKSVFKGCKMLKRNNR